ncbi:tyrosine-type recombinase/integrase, partial [Dactylosporangium sp. NPDC048998]|uniref:tyrosine-type recombinase/integrase n=1 Tax=Dactylosporangium sp. NPDC048998 TaxID=3363976 RepID=UPI003711343D
AVSRARPPTEFHTADRRATLPATEPNYSIAHIDPTTLTALTNTRPSGRAALVSGHMFLGRRGQPLRPDNLSNRFNQLARAAGVRPIGPHQIRHLLASNLLNLGYGIPEVAERLGHDPATLMRHYTRINAQRRRQAAHDLAQLITPTAALMDVNTIHQLQAA